MDEFEEINDNYRKGKYESLMKELREFVRSNAKEIWEFGRELARRNPESKIKPEDITRAYITQHNPVGAEYAIKWQLTLIEKEKWIRGIKTGSSPDPNQVAIDWFQEHGEACRKHMRAVLDVLVKELFAQDPNALQPEERPGNGKV